uniref:Uncharacterized protein n=1 Tax=Pseudictyota dubia TaxID=2749911 RepID=A0A7R9WDV2_9STRA|mmetsp:Transcript_46246/g.85978  ORF Transcript_46246/g.85978 Transcript_46246/m.85978 type:complete len:149 (+) Transcript_46246:167-613(+)
MFPHSRSLVGSGVRRIFCGSLPRIDPSTLFTSSISATYKSHDQNQDGEAAANRRAQQISSRQYHSTPRDDFLYPAIIVVAAIGYVGYKTYMGEPLTPKSLTSGVAEYERLEKDRKERNQRKRAFGYQKQTMSSAQEKTEPTSKETSGQ